MCHNRQASWDMGTTQEPCGLAQLSSRPSSLCALQAPRITLGSPEMRLHFVLRISPHPGLRPYLRLSPDLQSFSFAAHFFLLLQSLLCLSPPPPFPTVRGRRSPIPASPAPCEGCGRTPRGSAPRLPRAQRPGGCGTNFVTPRIPSDRGCDVFRENTGSLSPDSDYLLL